MTHNHIIVSRIVAAAGLTVLDRGEDLPQCPGNKKNIVIGKDFPRLASPPNLNTASLFSHPGGPLMISGPNGSAGLGLTGPAEVST